MLVISPKNDGGQILLDFVAALSQTNSTATKDRMCQIKGSYKEYSPAYN